MCGVRDAVALALGHDWLWVFANRILPDRIFANRIFADRRCRRRGRLLARQVGGGSSVQYGQDPNGAQHGDESGRAQHGQERSRYDLHHANPPICRSPRTSDRGRPYSLPAVELFHRCIFDPSQSTMRRATTFLTEG
jgi:hypothetical protein